MTEITYRTFKVLPKIYILLITWLSYPDWQIKMCRQVKGQTIHTHTHICLSIWSEFTLTDVTVSDHVCVCVCVVSHTSEFIKCQDNTFSTPFMLYKILILGTIWSTKNWVEFLIFLIFYYRMSLMEACFCHNLQKWKR